MRAGSIIVAVSLVVACTHDEEPGTPAGSCPEGLVALGAACIPSLDRCRADEVPLPGGGCKRVGVEECPGGIKGPPDWTCKAIGPPTTCKPGWSKVHGGWCEPVLPAAACPAGTMEVLGQSTCQPIGDCGTGTWGKLKTSTSTIFIDGSYRGGSPDGSQARPYPTIGAALAAASSGAHVAVAAGSYAEDVLIPRTGITLEGRCSRLVRIKSAGTSSSIAVRVTAAGVTLRGVTISSSYAGILTQGSKVTIEEVELRGVAFVAISVYDGSATIRDTVIHAAVHKGVDVWKWSSLASRPRADLQRVVVRGTTPFAPKSGFGVWVEDGEAQLEDSLVTQTIGVGVMATRGEVTIDRTLVSWTVDDPKEKATGSAVMLQAASRGILRDSLFRDNHGVGVTATSGSTLLLERSVVAGTRPYLKTLTRDGLRLDGVGVAGAITQMVPKRPKITIRQSLVVGNHSSGVTLKGAEGLVERSVVRDTRPLPKPSLGFDIGNGIQAFRQVEMPDTSILTVRDSLVAGNTTYGIMINSSSATLERAVIRDTRLGLADFAGRVSAGVQISAETGGPRPALTMRDSLISGHNLAGLYAESADLVLERSVVRDTVGTSKGNGTGLLVRTDPAGRAASKLSLVESVVARSRLAGIWLLGSKAVIKRSVVRETRATPSSGKAGHGIAATASEDKDGLPSSLDLHDSLVQDSRATGVLITDGKARVLRSVVRGTLANSIGYGDGLVVDRRASVLVGNTLVEENARAGLLFRGGGGAMDRSVVRANKVPVCLEQGASPTLGAGNVFSGNADDSVSRGSRFAPAALPAPVPLPAPPN